MSFHNNRTGRTRRHGTKENERVHLKCIVLGAANAGKTSILRRYFQNSFSPHRQPTLGSDFYSCQVPNPLYHHHISHHHEMQHEIEQQYISLQVWDTAGRERNAKYTAAYSDSFFQHADAAMLVYDATSSTSFTHLLRWHSDLMERMRKMNRPPFPVLVVANKMDIIQHRQTIKRPQWTAKTKEFVPKRDVMGLSGHFQGNDSHYEYRVSPSKDNGGTNKNKNISTYMATGDAWTSDGSYLDSVLHTEDRSHPDRDMVLLWCMRNGLKHSEVSALTGNGVDGAINTLIKLTIQTMRTAENHLTPSDDTNANMDINDNDNDNDIGDDTTGIVHHHNQLLYLPNKELDLRKLYEPKKRSLFQLLGCCK